MRIAAPPGRSRDVGCMGFAPVLMEMIGEIESKIGRWR
jgi:hypothetical protein